jgi:hypothetical protein
MDESLQFDLMQGSSKLWRIGGRYDMVTIGLLAFLCVHAGGALEAGRSGRGLSRLLIAIDDQNLTGEDVPFQFPVKHAENHFYLQLHVRKKKRTRNGLQ